MALLGGSVKDSILMPDPHTSVTSGAHNAGRSGPSEVPSLSSAGSGPTLPVVTFGEETPLRRPGGMLSRLRAPHTAYNYEDDMGVFSPLVEVQPITPSLDKLWDIHEGSKTDNLSGDNKKLPSSFVFPSSHSRFPFSEDGINEHPVSSSTSRQDDARSSVSHLGGSRLADTPITPPEAWGGERFDRIAHLRQASNVPHRFGMSTTSGSSMFDVSSAMNQTSMSSLTTSFLNARARDVSVSSSQESPTAGLANTEASGLASSTFARRYSTYAERISGDGTSLGVASPKVKKTGSETKEDLPNSLLSRSNSLAAAEPGVLPVANGLISQPLQHKVVHPDIIQPQQGGSSSFPLQIFQHTLEQTLGSFRDSIRQDMRNLHIEILRQFHMQESLYLENQAEMMKKIESLQKENRELRQLRR
ncbi:Protein NEDD1 [Linum grandiflorum]